MKSLKGNKPKLLKSVIHKVIDRSLLAVFTWTGKAGRGQRRKNALQGYPNILDVLRSIVEKLEGTYDEPLFLDHLKNKVIRTAYE